MFELTYEQIRNRDFSTGIRKIVNHDMTDFKKAYNISRMGSLINNEQKTANDTFGKLVKGHGKVIDERSGRYEIDDDKLDDWKKVVDDFAGHKFKVERHKIRVEDIEGIPLTPSEIGALEPLLDGLDALNN